MRISDWSSDVCSSDLDDTRIEVVVPDDQLSLAIGRRGQNVRLASQLTGSQIDIMTEADESEKRQKEFVERSELFQKELDVDETLLQLLVAERSEEHRTEFQYLIRNTTAVFCLKKKQTYPTAHMSMT